MVKFRAFCWYFYLPACLWTAATIHTVQPPFSLVHKCKTEQSAFCFCHSTQVTLVSFVVIFLFFLFPDLPFILDMANHLSTSLTMWSDSPASTMISFYLIGIASPSFAFLSTFFDLLQSYFCIIHLRWHPLQDTNSCWVIP